MVRKCLSLAVIVLLMLLLPHSTFAAPSHPTGLNQTSNAPVLTSTAFYSGDSTISIAGRLDSTPSSVFRIDFYNSAACDSTERTLLGSRDVFTDTVGTALFFRVQFLLGGAGSFITATATDEAGNTSALSTCRQVTEGYTSENVMRNFSFEANSDANWRVPDEWTAAWNGGRSWHSCNVTAMDGQCSAVAEMAGGYARLDQTLQFSGAPGDKVSLYFWVEASNVSTSSYIRMRLYFYNNGSMTESRLQNIPTGSYGWQNKVLELTITQPFNSVEIEFQTSNSHGTLWLDRMDLIYIDQ